MDIKPESLEEKIKVPGQSPKWNNNTKLLVGLTFVAVAAYMLIQFHTLLGPLLVSFILSYLFYPISKWLVKVLHASWSLVVTLLYLLLLITILGLMTWGGLAIVEQIQSLIIFLENQIENLPTILNQIATTSITIGPFQYDLSHLDLSSASNQILSTVQPVLSQIGSLVGTIATSAFSTIGWLLFILVISYFVLRETGGEAGKIINMDIPGYTEDMRRLSHELGRIWDTFLRGQLLIVALVIIVYTILLGGLQVRYFFGLAVLAGLARFVPYVGPFVAWSTYGLVCYFQGTTIFGMSAIGYALLIVGIAFLTDSLIDNLISTPLLAGVLNIHPAAVMVAALVAVNLLGMTGVVLAAPVLATLSLAVKYAGRKLFDLDPWAGIHTDSVSPPNLSIRHHLRKIKGFYQRIIPDQMRKKNIEDDRPK
ncbi:MAG: AI-2E family transporter [Anaerolineaceae bacterium]